MTGAPFMERGRRRMIEAFERHLRTHNISKQFEEAKTKEDKIEICKKFLESEGHSVKSNLDPEKQFKELNTPMRVGGSGNLSSGILTLDANAINNLVIGGAGGGGGNIIPNSLTWGDISTGTTVTKQPKYFQVHYKLTENEELKFQNQSDVRLHIMNELMRELSAGLKKFVIQNNLIKSETDYSTLDKHYTIKVGFIE